MAKAARKGMTGQLEGGGGTDGTGEGLGIGEGKGEGEEEHPLSEGKLEERSVQSTLVYPSGALKSRTSTKRDRREAKLTRLKRAFE